MAISNSLNIDDLNITTYTGAAIFSGRTVTGTSNQATITNGTGISGNIGTALTSDIYVSGISFDSGTNIMTTFSEGTFTPKIVGATTAGAQAYNYQYGYYQRRGNVCSIDFATQTTSNSGTGLLNFIDIPFTASNTFATAQIVGGAFKVATIYYSANYFLGANTTIYSVMQHTATSFSSVSAVNQGTFTHDYFI